jgi:CBS domain-containing protein
LSNSFSTHSVSDFIEPLETFDPSDSVSSLVGRLKETRAYEGFMEESGKTSMVSIRDILAVENVATTKVSNIMHAVPSLNSDDSITYAARLMFQSGIRSLPVYTKDKLEGKVTSTSLAKNSADSNSSKVALSKIMTANPIVLDASDSMAKARSTMLKMRIDQIPILKGARLNGVITSVDIVFSFLSLPGDRDSKGDREESRFGNTASSLASGETTTNNIEDSPSKVIENMMQYSTNYSLILEAGVLKGIVTFRDFLKLLAVEGESQTIPVTIIGLPDNPLEADIVEAKFKTAVRLLQTMAPTVCGARAVIKNKEVGSGAMLHQVQVFVDGTNWHESYEASGYDVSKIFGEIDSWIRRIASRYDEKPDRKRWQNSPRHSIENQG